MMESHVTPTGLILLLVPMVAGSLLAASALTLVRPKPVTGWRLVVPGIGYWTALVLSLGLSGFTAWIWAFVGSARADAAFQMQVAWWLAFLFGCGGAFAGHRIMRIHRQSLRWRGDQLAWSSSGGNVAIRSLAALETGAFGFALARFTGGEHLRIDLAAAGATSLIDRLEELNALARQDRSGDH